MLLEEIVTSVRLYLCRQLEILGFLASHLSSFAVSSSAFTLKAIAIRHGMDLFKDRLAS